jgi:hypothetical protein
MTITNEVTVISFLEQHVNRQLLRYAAGTAIFCPRCGEIMDCERTVVATVHRKLAGKEEEIVATYTQCAKCWDKASSVAVSAVEKVARQHPELNARMEIVDGRRFDWSAEN